MDHLHTRSEFPLPSHIVACCSVVCVFVVWCDVSLSSGKRRVSEVEEERGLLVSKLREQQATIELLQAEAANYRVRVEYGLCSVMSAA